MGCVIWLQQVVLVHSCFSQQAGSWVIEAAKEWPSTHFVCIFALDSCSSTNVESQVGFDLVNVQLPLNLLDPSLEERIKWIYGNLCVLVSSVLLLKPT